MSLLDPLLATFNRIFNKYLQGKVDPSHKISLLAEVRRVTIAVTTGQLDLDEAKQYLHDFLTSLYGDDLDDDTKNKVVDEIIRAIKVEVTREQFAIPKKRGFSLT